MYERLKPQVLPEPTLMYLVVDPGPNVNLDNLELRPLFITKITEHHYMYVSARGAAHSYAKWRDTAFGFTGQWLFAKLEDAMEAYHSRLIVRRSYANEQAVRAQREEDTFLNKFNAGKVPGDIQFTWYFESQAMEIARVDYARAHEFKQGDKS